MYIQGMQRGLCYILQGFKPRTFEKLDTQAHDMELSIAVNGSQWLLFQDPYKGEIKPNNRKGGNKSFSKLNTKDSMAIITAPVKISAKSKKKEVENVDSMQEKWRKKLTLEEMQNKEYHFPDAEVPKMLD